MSKRTSMLGSAVRELIAPVIRQCPRECGIISITRVEISEDASYATIYISALQEPTLAMEFLKGEQKKLQRRLGELGLRVMPLLRFRLEREEDRPDRILELLEKASKQLPEDSSKTMQE